ncbi:demethoxyubiquinone hydroxylase family protein [Asticcacaulis sp. ZE23SCel15]|uniref:demethoxyubiquinone hydroxylase family protein n=1 Tax=Asticcacaulis sp. ZE23SCel15 TaxID=3059027 RepID=UPI00265E98B3|nr:demethoxyubiquinone hydroxylase family protein [Asticcacaulis sp. ZE23SCel15]WKL57046.1 demethoxyubiquinone hydroxylase family protein [Asticcacaulis sp. ZE23SCel15]
MTPEQKTISRILKVNHAGEYGAIRIYRAQIFVSKYLHKDLMAFLEETVSHEIDHCRMFREAMSARQSRPCYAMWLWGLGGTALGLITAIMGKNAIMVCTAAVERTVHRHLEEQIEFLAGRDEALKVAIADIQAQELGHLLHAEAHIRPGPLNRWLSSTICVSTEVVIWLSTQGAVSRMQRALSLLPQQPMPLGERQP